MTETAEQIRAAVLDEWCVICNGPVCQRPHTREEMLSLEDEDFERPPLFDRWPEARVPGLEWSEETEQWVLRKHIGGPQVCRLRECEPHHAALLIKGHLSGLLAEASTGEDEAEWQDRARWRVQLLSALASPTPVRDLSALGHRLYDAREQQEKP